MSFDFLGTVGRLADGKSVGQVYRNFTRYLSPKSSSVALENMAMHVRQLPADDIDAAFRQSFRSAASAASASNDGLQLFLPHEERTISVRVPGGTTHEETEEFWLHVLRHTFAGALRRQHPDAKNERVAEAIHEVLESECFVEEFFYPLYEHMGSALAYESPRRVLDCLAWLKTLRCAHDGHQMKLVLVSNFDVRVHNIAKGLSLDLYFDKVISTHESKCLKPDPTPVRMAMEEGKCSFKAATEWVHVGDADADARAAKEAPCLFCPAAFDMRQQMDAVGNSEDELLRRMTVEEKDQLMEGLIALPTMRRFMFRHFANPEHHSVKLAAASGNIPIAAISK